MASPQLQDQMLLREEIANRKKHWVRAVTACNSRCLFCLDMDTPRNVFLPFDEVARDLEKGRNELDADKVIISGGEASLHPQFFDLIRYAKEIGYDRVQTVTNGWKYADRKFYRDSIKAGLGEITFSLHGHTQELHDRLTAHPGSFKRIMKAIIRAVRDPRGPIVNVDVVINKQNVGVLDKIVELCISVGVTEFDLLHVIPQSEAFRNRDLLFYDVRDHIDVLHKVFRLNRHPGFVIWTNRFPVSYLEGLEDLIQDPHKMLDEVNGRRFQVRRYLDTGETLDCRQPERCKHCFIESFCTSMERFVSRQNESQFNVWQSSGPVPEELPYGCTHLGIALESPADLEPVSNYPLEIRTEEPGPLPDECDSVRWVADTPAKLSSWIESLPDGHELLIELNRKTAEWMLENREVLKNNLSRVHVEQPTHEKMSTAIQFDVRDPAKFFNLLSLPISTSGLAACLAPNTRLVEPIQRVGMDVFENETGRVGVRKLAKHHIEKGYFAKSERCRDCRLTDLCDGIHINMIRDQGLKLARPVANEPWADSAESQLNSHIPKARIRDGAQAQKAAPSLPGYAPPVEPEKDPLAVIAEAIEVRRAKRRARLFPDKGKK